MPIKINGTNTAANPSITGDDTDTGIVYGSDQIDFSTGGSSKVTLNGSNLGIGIQSPQEILHVKGASETISSRDGVIFGSTDSLAADKGLPLVWTAHIGTDANYGIASICGRKENATNDNGAGYLQFGTGNSGGAITERMRIDSSGQVFIGTTSTPNGTSSYGVGFINENDSRKVFYTAVNSTAQKSLVRFHNGNGQVGAIFVNGTATSYVTSSDYRLKENAVAISDGITRLKTLKPYRFNFKTDASTILDGFFAHEVTAVPEAITGTKDETQDILYTEDDTIPSGKKIGDVKEVEPIYQGIDQSKLVPLLTAALQEAIAKIETLETKVAALEAK